MTTGTGAGSRSASARSAALAFALVALAACGSNTPASTPSPLATATPAMSASASPEPSPSVAPSAAPLVETLDVAKVMKHVRVLSEDIGLRNSGSDADKRASIYISQQIEALGWTVERRPFPLPQGGESWNVVGTPPGFDERKPYVIVGGHYDSLNGPGANDNATGVSVAIEIAHYVASHPARVPVVFVGFGAEERQPTPNKADHHVGSRYYVSKMSSDARKNLVSMVNVDMVGHGDVLECDYLAAGGSHEGADRCLRLAKQLGYRVTQRPTPNWSDHGSFIEAGMNASWVWSGDYLCCYHNPRDTTAIVRTADLTRSATLALAIVRSYTR